MRVTPDPPTLHSTPTFHSTKWSIISATSDYHLMTGGADDTTVLYLSGELDIATHDTLVQRLNQAASGNRTVIVNLSQTTFMDSTGLRALLQVRQSQTAAGNDLVLRDPSDPVLLTLRHAGLEDVFTIEHRDDPKT